MNIPKTVPALIEWFGRHFVCFQGPKIPYFEIETGPDTMFRGVYETYAVKTITAPDHEKSLVEAMYQQFEPVAGKDDGLGPTLFWRLPEKIVLKQEILLTYEVCAVTEEQVQDGLPIPEGCIRSEIDNCYYRSVKSETAWSLRTRLVIPVLAWSEQPTPNALLTRLVKKEGFETVTI